MSESPEAKERALARARAWKAANPERVRAMRRAYRLANKERENASTQKWLAEHPERASEIRLRRAPYIRDWQASKKAARTGLPVMFKPSDVRTIHGGACWACGATDRVSMDHITPLSRGGTNFAHNVRLLCEACNRKKHRRLDHEIQDPEFRSRLFLGHEAFTICMEASS